MLTPRRTWMLLAGFLGFTTAYIIYSQLLGWIDGLPQLPPEMLDRRPVEFQPPDNSVSPTQKKLADAFGANARETDYAFYPNQFSFYSGDSVIVLASGPCPSEPRSNRVTLTPFSLAIFSKPKPPHLCQPGEVAEITTVHADKGILEFDRVINNQNDMRTAKIQRLELISDFEQTAPDPRRGLVHITNNQRSADPNRFLVMRTVGPAFYRDAKAVAGTPAAQGPDFWTDAPVEIVDRQNLPRAIGAGSATVVSRADDLRNNSTVESILAGKRPPPPTVTGIGLRIYLEPTPQPGQPPKKAGSGLSGVRRIDLLEQVVVNLWIDNGSSFVGDAPAPAQSETEPQSGNSLALVPPPAALAAITGGMGTSAYTARLMNRALLQVETRGPFAYESEKSTARFDVVPNSDPNLANDVQVTKVPAVGGNSTLFSQVLELELNGGATTANRPSNAPAIKRTHAWTYTPGRILSLASQPEAMEAYGQDLIHDQAASRTVLTGSPLTVVRERNVLIAGTPQRAATFTSEPEPNSKPGPERKSQATVRGPGRVNLYDTTANAPGPSASWATSMVHSKEVVRGVVQELFTFTDDAKFEDLKADYWLKANVLKLWLAPQVEPNTTADGRPLVGPPAPPGSGSAAAGGQPKPSRVQAVGMVTSHSTDYEIKEADVLNAFISDARPVAVAAAPVPPSSPSTPAQPIAKAPTPMIPMPGGPPTMPPAAPPVPAPTPAPTAVASAQPAEKPKPPYEIRAKLIDTWVTRTTTPSRPAKPGDKAGNEPAETSKYQLDRARCEDNVRVHQDPADPSKPRGVDILGRLLLIDGSPDGNIMTVFGWLTRPGEVHQEDMSLIGPEVKLDQVHNWAHVTGRGALTLPTNSDLTGSTLSRSEVVVIHWRDSMDFKGALRSAKFEGKVSARQGDAWILCNTMHVTFDRPVYFNQAQRNEPPKPKAANPKDPKAPDDDKPKIDTVFCYPAAGDSADNPGELVVTYNEVAYDKSGALIKSQQLTAQELQMFAQAQDPAGGEKYQRIVAEGPGVLRVWQLEDKDSGGNGQNKPAPVPVPPGQPMGMKPVQAGDDKDQEMKLTVIEFRGRMTAVDKAKVFKQSNFKGPVQVVNVPADSPTLEVQRHKLPPRAQLMTCTKELVVWSHKKPNAEPVQRMDAYGNAFVRNDEYEGYGDIITHDGQIVTLTGSEATPARFMNRFNQGNSQAGETIIYDRAKGSIKVNKSFGGTLGK